MIVDGGRFDWHASGKFPALTEPYAGYHGIVFDEQFGHAAFIMRARTEGLRDFGACLSPTNAFQLLQGDRDARRSHGAPYRRTRRGAGIPGREQGGRMGPASLAGNPSRLQACQTAAAARRGLHCQLRHQGRPAGRKEIHRSAASFSHLANVGDAKTLVIHPASTTHQQMDAAQLEAAGIGEELVRLSVGIESAADIVDDLGQALRISQKV